MKIVSDKPLRVATLGGTAVLFEAGVREDTGVGDSDEKEPLF